MKRKAISIILAIALCAGLTVPALAAEGKTVTATGEFVQYTITNVIKETRAVVDISGVGDGLNVVIYQVPSEGATIVFNFVDGFVGSDAHKQYIENYSWMMNQDALENRIAVVKAAPGWIAPDSELVNQSRQLVKPSTDPEIDPWENGIDEYYGVIGADNIAIVYDDSAESSVPPSEQPSSWATDQVNAAIATNLVPASLQSKYTQPTTRAEFCALAVALYESINGEIADRSSFTDTNDVNVQKAAAIGIVSGVGDNKFAPDTQLTREQAATMLSRLADAIGKPLTKQAATFADNAQISSWAADAVGQMQATGIMGGVGNNMFAPKDPYTREQSIVTIMRLFEVVK